MAKVGIIIITMDRSDFLIRQLRYYAELRSPHPIYIIDSSTKETFEKNKKIIDELKKYISVYYYHYPKEEFSLLQCHKEIRSKVKEKYITFIGDDDYQIPNSLTKCAEFLENNPDYSTASGLAVSIRLIENRIHGSLQRISDYPRREVLFDNASQRFVHFMDNYFVNIFSVSRTELMKEIFSIIPPIKDKSLEQEILPCCLITISGKAKLLDCLGFVRQIHDSHYPLPDVFDWLSGINFHESYLQSRDILAKAVAKKDGIDFSQAQKIVRQGFWLYSRKSLIKEYDQVFPVPRQIPGKIGLKTKIGLKFPFLKRVYRATIRPLISNSKQLHYEVLQPNSKYYKDFRPVMDSFLGKNNY